MTADHPTIDTIADYHAGLLAPQHAASMAAHLSGCPDCTAASHAVGEVSTILAEAGGVVSIPDDVADRLDEALRQAADERADADRSGTVLPLERPASAVAPSAERRRSWPLLAAAAAVLVVVGTAVLGDLDLSPGGAAESSAARGAPAAERAESDVDAGAAAGGGDAAETESDQDALEQGRLERLSPARLPGYADRLAQSPAPMANKFSARSAPCAQVSAGPKLSPVAGDVVSTVRWKGSPAVVVVDPQARTATVLDCETASVVLFRTEY